jgi:hypothetical protein
VQVPLALGDANQPAKLIASCHQATTNLHIML